MIKRVALLVTIFTLSLSIPALAAEPGTGVIEGQLVNGTIGGSSVADQDITLKTYLNDAEVGATTTNTDAEGRFVFDDLLTESDYNYEATLVFQQAEYYSGQLSFDGGEIIKSIEVTVYDSTTTDEAIKVATAHTIIYIGQGSLQVEEYYLFVNEADRTYIGSKVTDAEGTRETLRFSLPNGVTELQSGLGLMQCCIVSNEEGFANTMSVLPGTKEVAYSYTVDYSSGVYKLPQKINYPTADFDLMVQGEGVQVAVNRLATKEPLDIAGVQFSHLTGIDLAAGDILEIQLSGLPETDSQSAVIWVILSLIVLVGAFGLGYSMRRKKAQPVSSDDDPEQKRQRLLVELAHLDDDFESGKIPESAYRKLRTETKAQLLAIMQGENGGTDNK